MNLNTPSALVTASAMDVDMFADDEDAFSDMPLHQRVWHRLKTLPIVIFYKYLWRTNKRLLGASLFVNYLLPLILELLPWVFSRRKVGNVLRENRNTINHNMINGGQFSSRLMTEFVLLTLLHAALETIDRQLRNRLAYSNRYVIRKLVMERILFSELQALERVKTADLESRITQDINQTLNLFNYTIPGILGGVYATVREGMELWAERAHIHPLALLRPVLLMLFNKAVELGKFYLIEEQQERNLRNVNTEMTRLISNTFEGLCEIQINNLQQSQLHRLDGMIGEEIETSFGMGSTLSRIWSAISSRSLLDCVSEAWVVHKVMESRGITHQQYRKVQNDVDHAVMIARRTFAYMSLAKRVFDRQGRIVFVLTLPSFLDEWRTLRTALPPFERLYVRDVQFSYGPQLPLALNLQGEMIIERGRVYAIVGQNRSGKSTLTNIICKLFQPKAGTLLYNDIPYEQIARVALRDMISYVTQKPFIFPGSIRENIMIGNQSASHAQVLAAAEAAGVLMYAAPPAEPAAGAASSPAPGAAARASPSTGVPCAVPARPPLAAPAPMSPVLQAAVRYRLGGEGVSCGGGRPDDIDWDRIVADAAATVSGEPPAVSPFPTGAADHRHGGASAAHGASPASEHRSAADHKAAAAAAARAATAESAQLQRCSERFRDFAADVAGGHPYHPGLDMQLAARGTNISGGFAQSVALARIFLRTQARIVILDEATGQMDGHKKNKVIMPALRRFVREHGMALIMISHDMPSIADVDHIFVLEGGALVHQGTHAELVAQGAPAYVRLLADSGPVR